MGKYKWHKHRKGRVEDISTWRIGSSGMDGTYTIDWSSHGFTGAPTVTTSTPAIIGAGSEIRSGYSSTIIENTLTIPYESIEAVGTVEEFIERILPDGYRLLEYNINNMDYSSSNQALDVATIHYRAELDETPLMVTNEFAYGSDDSETISISGGVLTPDVIQNGFSTAIANFGAA